MQDSPVVPIGRSPRTDVLLKAEKVVLESGGCAIRLAGLYISFSVLNYVDFINSWNGNFRNLWWIHLTLTADTKQIEVRMLTGWRRVLLKFVQITSWILFTMRSNSLFFWIYNWHSFLVMRVILFHCSYFVSGKSYSHSRFCVFIDSKDFHFLSYSML